jgi:hypothetical protein
MKKILLAIGLTLALATPALAQTVEERVTNLEGAGNSLSAQVTALQAGVAALQAGDTAQVAAIAANAAAIAANAAAIAMNAGDIAANTTEIGIVDAAVGSIMSDVAALDARVTALEGAGGGWVIVNRVDETTDPSTFPVNTPIFALTCRHLEVNEASRCILTTGGGNFRGYGRVTLSNGVQTPSIVNINP